MTLLLAPPSGTLVGLIVVGSILLLAILLTTLDKKGPRA